MSLIVPSYVTIGVTIVFILSAGNIASSKA